MIWESQYWKDDLLKNAAALRKRTTQKRWAEPSLARLEQSIMLGFYGVRKLHEAAKLSTATMTQQVSVKAFPWLGKNVTKLNWHRLDELYDFASGAPQSQDLLFVCHQFVHSFIFTTAFNEDGRLDAILFASDRQRHKALLSISIGQVISAFEQVGNDYPNSAQYILNAKTGDYDVVATMLQNVS